MRPFLFELPGIIAEDASRAQCAGRSDAAGFIGRKQSSEHRRRSGVEAELVGERPQAWALP